MFGLDTVKKAAACGQIYLLLTAADLSSKTVKEVEFLSNKYHIPHLALQSVQEYIAQTIGKKTGVIGITDPGFSTKLMQICNETEDTLCR